MNERVRLPSWPLGPVQAIAEARGIRLWLVGGVVRDALLGRPLHDWDFAVEQDGLGLARAVADALHGAYYPLDTERDTGRVVLHPTDGPALTLDFARLRGPDLEADLHGRDFTLNAMAIGPEGELIDPLGGLEDLQARRIRALSPKALDDDPLRMLRAVRLVAEIGLHLEPDTAGWIAGRAATLTRASAERIREEFVRLLAAPTPARHLHLLDELGLLVQVIPETAPLKGQRQTAPHRFDVWWHTLHTVETAAGVLDGLTGQPPHTFYTDAPAWAWEEITRTLARFAPAALPPQRSLFILAALCHDLGKPLTAKEEEGRLHFYGHEDVGAGIAAERLRALRFSNAETERVRQAVAAHLRPSHLAQAAEPPTRRAIYRYFRDLGDVGVEVVLLSLADHLATWGANLQVALWERWLGTAETLLEHYFEHHTRTVAPPPLVNGQELMAALNLLPGPEVGRLLAAIREAQAAGEVHSREEALSLARRLMHS